MSQSRIAIPSTEEERIRLIGELLCKAIVRASFLDPAVTPRPLGSPLLATFEDRIVDYLRQRGPASPKEMRAMLGCSRSRIQLALQRLRLSGRVMPCGGRTTAVSYRWVDPTRN